MTPDEQREWLACRKSALYFIHRYCWIEDATAGVWIPFRLWRAQARTLQTIADNRLVAILKARQLGLTWLVVAFALWLMLFWPAATVLLFSRRDDEAVHLLGHRLKGMYKRLPAWMRVREILIDNDHQWRLSNGSVAYAFPTTAGDSYTATLAIVDEADLVADLGRLMRAVKPTIDGGGRMILLSRSDKGRPRSEFKNIYRGAKSGASPWADVFLPWYVRPGRDATWYAEQEADIMARTGALDDLYEQYPATDTEALSPRVLDKRIPFHWIEACFDELDPLPDHAWPAEVPSLPNLEIYAPRISGRQYVIGVDPAEGNPTSDPSALEVLDVVTGEEMAALAGRIEPSTMAAYAHDLGVYYNNAGLMVERNNHGHAVILWLEDNSHLAVLPGWDGRPGWHSTSRGKVLLYAAVADAFRDEDTILRSFATYTQLMAIEGSSLRAPEGEHDDRADAFALAQVGRTAEGGQELVVGVSPVSSWRG
jgi:hypothetical protein